MLPSPGRLAPPLVSLVLLLSGCGGDEPGPDRVGMVGTVAGAAQDGPAVEILSPAPNAPFLVEGDGVDVEVSVAVTGGAPGADLQVEYLLDGEARATRQDADPVVLQGAPPGRRQVAVRLVDGTGEPLDNPGSLARLYVKVLPSCPGGPPDCEDGLACSAHACTSGTCNYGPEPGDCCDHDLECPFGWSCVDGGCQECVGDGQCDDGDPCTVGTCGADGSCTFELQPDCCSADGDPCSDGDPCTGKGTCQGGSCQPGPALDCDDGNPCTDDACEPGVGCTHAFNTAPCDDGNACTVDDTCEDGACVGAPANCAGDGAAVVITSPANNADFTDTSGAGVAVEMLVQVDGVLVAPETFHVRYLLDGQEVATRDQVGPYTFDAVPVGRHHLAARVVRATGEGLPGAESRASVYVEVGRECSSIADCDDGLTCSNQNCLGGECRFGPVSGCCDHDPECPYTWVCVDGQCMECFDDADCTDFDPCTVDACTAEATCESAPIPGCCESDSECDDADACTEDRCVDNACENTDVSAGCLGDDPCYDYGCDALNGCTQVANTAACDDGSACTLDDACLGGTCEPGAPLDCDDGNPCTDDLCDPLDGCVHEPNEAACDDGDACTLGDTCSAGACEPGIPATCDDGTPCTADQCDPSEGCVFPPAEASCDDGDACTVDDRCQAGACVGDPAPPCDDGNACTDDLCDPKDGCLHPPNADPCDDGEPCTTGDQCSGGACVGGPGPDCDDGDPCTDDACEPGTGCTHTALTGCEPPDPGPEPQPEPGPEPLPEPGPEPLPEPGPEPEPEPGPEPDPDTAEETPEAAEPPPVEPAPEPSVEVVEPVEPVEPEPDPDTTEETAESAPDVAEPPPVEPEPEPAVEVVEPVEPGPEPTPDTAEAPGDAGPVEEPHVERVDAGGPPDSALDAGPDTLSTADAALETGSSGCGCRSAPGPGGRADGLLLLAPLAWLVVRCRRRAPLSRPR